MATQRRRSKSRSHGANRSAREDRVLRQVALPHAVVADAAQRIAPHAKRRLGGVARRSAQVILLERGEGVAEQYRERLRSIRRGGALGALRAGRGVAQHASEVSGLLFGAGIEERIRRGAGASQRGVRAHRRSTIQAGARAHPRHDEVDHQPSRSAGAVVVEAERECHVLAVVMDMAAGTTTIRLDDAGERTHCVIERQAPSRIGIALPGAGAVWR